MPAWRDDDRVSGESMHDGLPVEERQRLDQCAREPIHAPGAIQPHGALIGVDPLTFVVTTVSENVSDLLGVPAPVLGRPLAEVFGAGFADDVRVSASGADVEANLLDLVVGEHAFDAIVHPRDDVIIVELEPVPSASLQHSTSSLYGLLHRIAKSSDIEELRTGTARGLRALTGFDRVMVYHFHPDGHGEIVAEDRAPGMEPYLGLHFPASDIPAQARELYLTKLSRAIVGTSGDSVRLLTLRGDRGSALDLSCAELRSVSPHHLQFMRNMGQDSTLSFSLVRDGVLIGMITCAHRSQRRLPCILRRGIEVLANQVALQLSALDQVARLRRQVSVRKWRALLMAQISVTDDIAESLLRGGVTVRDLIESDGAAVRIGGRTRTTGDVPTTAGLEALFEHVAQAAGDGPFVSDALAGEHPALSALAPTVTGVLIVLVGGAGDYLAFFRNEVLRSVDWLGDQTDANRATPLSPRTSFSAWTDSVAGTSSPWGELVSDAAELARDLEGTLFRKAESELAHLAMQDPLTGLPNRRRLIDELDVALGADDARTRVSMLFIDLDGFKGVNDSYGHDVGDALIVTVAERLLAATRASDTVARIGGDEFVVLCTDTDPSDADLVAARVLSAISEPVRIGRDTITVTASVGAAAGDEDVTATDLLRQADEAMYRAKASGKNAVSR